MLKVRISPGFVALALLTSSGCESCDDRVLPPPLLEDPAVRFAQAACMAEVNCGCRLYDSTEECENELTTRFEDTLANGVTIDEDCFEQYLESEVFQGCPSDLSAGAIPECVAMIGSAVQGEPCLPFSFLTMLPGQGCRTGLACSLEGVCGDGGEPKQAGDPCDPAFGFSCGYDLYCSSAGACVPRVPGGQSCDEPLACEIGWYCDELQDGGIGTCALQLAEGESCELDEVGSCAGTLRCHSSTLQCDGMVPFSCVNLSLL